MIHENTNKNITTNPPFGKAHFLPQNTPLSESTKKSITLRKTFEKRKNVHKKEWK